MAEFELFVPYRSVPELVRIAAQRANRKRAHVRIRIRGDRITARRAGGGRSQPPTLRGTLVPEAGGTRIVGRRRRIGSQVFNGTFVFLAVWMGAFAIGIGVSDGAANPGFVICTVSAVLFAFIGMGLILMAPMVAEIEKGMLAGALLRLFATEDDLAPKQA